MLYNVYCDETCHLEHDGINDMVIGSVWCPQHKLTNINQQISQIKASHHIPASQELKWTKISPGCVNVYRDLINYFFSEDDLHFRAVIIPDKTKLNHSAFHQTHDDWYYKMYFDMLKVILNPRDTYEVYIDIKDSHSYEKTQILKDVCSHSMYDFSYRVIQRMQPIRSEEVQIMQLVDVLIGAIGYANRKFPDDFKGSTAKTILIQDIKDKTGYSLNKTTLYREEKCNLLLWDAREL